GVPPMFPHPKRSLLPAPHCAPPGPLTADEKKRLASALVVAPAQPVALATVTAPRLAHTFQPSAHRSLMLQPVPEVSAMLLPVPSQVRSVVLMPAWSQAPVQPAISG